MISLRFTHFIVFCLSVGTWGACVGLSRAGEMRLEPTTQGPGNTLLEFIQARGLEMRSGDKPPGSLEQWKAQRTAIRERLLKAWGGFPEHPCPLNPRQYGELKREGYRVEKLAFQTLPDVWMTANAYVPDKPGKLPGVLCVHGHWKGAKQDPAVQARCIGLAKLGFFVLVVDAFGSGERGVGEALGEYHGEMVGATLFPVGRPLSGLQVYENQRAVDYLLTRPEVDGERLGITGASGGGNQTMYAGAWDERFQAVVPVCSVGTYQAYLGAACCMCEVVPGAMKATEEGGILSLVAPRALMVINATRDAFQFSVGEARKSIAYAASSYQLHGQPGNIRHTIFESGHDYSEVMREAMYGWMTMHLKGEGTGSPIEEPEIKPEDPEALRCFPGTTRPDDWVTIPRFAAREGRKLLDRIAVPSDSAQWRAMANTMKTRLDRDVLGGTAPRHSPKVISRKSDSASAGRSLEFEPEPGIRLSLTETLGKEPRKPGAVMVLSLEEQSTPTSEELAKAVRESGRAVIELGLRGTGKQAFPRDKIGRAPDHNTAEWSLWVGRPLLGQWVLDVRAALNALDANGGIPKELTVIGIGPAGVVALCVGALDSRVSGVVSVRCLSSYLSEAPYEGQRLGIMAPGIVRDVGDIPRIAAILAPRKLVIASGVDGAGRELDQPSLRRQYDFLQRVYSLENAAAALSISDSMDAGRLIRLLDTP